MKKDLMEILCCPSCKGELLLTVRKEEEDEVVEGQLACRKCGVDYTIEEGIPNLLPKNVK